MKLINILSKTFLIIIVLFQSANFQQVCSSSCQKKIKLNENKLEERIIEKVEPEYPPGCDCKGKVIATISVNKKGKVIKVRSEGNSLFRHYVDKALKKWKFKPLKKDGKFTCFTGKITHLYE